MISKRKLYLDVCTLCRPFDDQDMMRIRLETDAFYLILENIKNKNYEMIFSPVHLKEIQIIEEICERLELITLLTKFGVIPACDLEKIRQRAEYFFSLKFGVADAAHLAYAEETSDFFITCDDKVINKCKKIKIKLMTMGPIEFCIKENLK